MLDNPVLRKEMMSVVRLRQTPMPARVGIGIGIGVMLLWIYYQVIGRWLLTDTSPSSGGAAWAVIVSIQFTLICLIAPIIAANAITREKEQQTWESLIFTSLAPGEIIFGKLVARLSIVAGIVLLLVPIELFGWAHSVVLNNDPASTSRVSFSQVGLALLTRVVCMVFFATLGLFLSWLLQRTLYAIMISYTLVIGVLVIGTGLVTLMLNAVFSDSEFVFKCPLMWVNPVMLITEAINPTISPSAVLFLLYGLAVYIVITLVMLWRMVYGFRRFAFQK